MVGLSQLVSGLPLPLRAAQDDAESQAGASLLEGDRVLAVQGRGLLQVSDRPCAVSG